MLGRPFLRGHLSACVQQPHLRFFTQAKWVRIIVWICVQPRHKTQLEACHKLTLCISQMKYLCEYRAHPLHPLPPSPRPNPDFHPLYFPRHDIALGRGIKTVRISDAVRKIISQ